MQLTEKTRPATDRTHVSVRRQLAIWWRLAHTDQPVECRAGCRNGTDPLTSCNECRQADMADRAAW